MGPCPYSCDAKIFEARNEGRLLNVRDVNNFSEFHWELAQIVRLRTIGKSRGSSSTLFSDESRRFVWETIINVYFLCDVCLNFFVSYLTPEGQVRNTLCKSLRIRRAWSGASVSQTLPKVTVQALRLCRLHDNLGFKFHSVKITSGVVAFVYITSRL